MLSCQSPTLFFEELKNLHVRIFRKNILKKNLSFFYKFLKKPEACSTMTRLIPSATLLSALSVALVVILMQKLSREGAESVSRLTIEKRSTNSASSSKGSCE